MLAAVAIASNSVMPYRSWWRCPAVGLRGRGAVSATTALGGAERGVFAGSGRVAHRLAPLRLSDSPPYPHLRCLGLLPPMPACCLRTGGDVSLAYPWGVC